MTSEKYVELIWNGKYGSLQKGDLQPFEKPNLPFQPVETINLPRVKGGVQQALSGSSLPENYPREWKNFLTWGDNRLVMSGLIKQGWAGKIRLIYIDPPFFTGAKFDVKTQVGGNDVTKEPSIIEARAYSDFWHGGIASYLREMYSRLAMMKELLTEDGSIYVHLDSQAHLERNESMIGFMITSSGRTCIVLASPEKIGQLLATGIFQN